MKLTLAISWILVFVGMTAAQQPGNATRDAYTRGLAIVERAYAASGGDAAIERANLLRYSMNGKLSARNQSFRPETPFDAFAVETAVTFDLKSETIVTEQRSSLPGGLTFANRSVASRTREGFNLNLERNNYTVLPANSPVFGQGARLMPVYFLRRLLEQRATLRFAGTVRFAGRTHDLVTTVWNNQVFTLYFDRATGHLSKSETLAADAASGDDLFEFITSDYKQFGPFWLPTKLEQKRSGKTVRISEYRYETPVAGAIDPRLLTRSADAVAFQPTPFAVKKLSDTAYLAEGVNGGGYRVLFVELEDGVLVVDAPGTSSVSRSVIDEIRKAIPSKPIKYLVLTHFHEDHTGGIREYVAEGATIVTTTGNRPFFDSIVNTRYTIQLDRLARSPAVPKYLIVDSDRNFGNRVTVRNAGNPHAKDMYLVYLPNEKLVFQSDLYNWPDRAVTDSTVDMLAKIDQFGWDVVNVISSHGGTVPMAQIRDEVAAFKARATK